MPGLEQQHCSPATALLDTGQVQDYLLQLQDWLVAKDSKSIQRRYSFKNYKQTLAFVNAAAGIANTEDHHPNICFGYNYCEILYSTHSVGGLSENDFICASHTDMLFTNT